MTEPGGPPAPAGALPQRQVALIDLLDRLLSGGVVLSGDLVLSIADIDLVRISLRALIVSISEDHPSPWDTALRPTSDVHDPPPPDDF
ncbi:MULTISPECIES: gas vesicle protein [Streptomyces]|uniref:gas vesicle protein n=1 Tax=Streptomyces TaxID=1883 RepID=UPI001F2AE032|nr:gas vesicle protein [Streptomyces noursei]MCE4946679.1 gas vesicle protein [Streptomyces noursei]